MSYVRKDVCGGEKSCMMMREGGMYDGEERLGKRGVCMCVCHWRC